MENVVSEKKEQKIDKTGRIIEADFLRTLCCLGVVMIHVSGLTLAAVAKSGFITEAVFVTLNQIVRYSLFGFVFLSGLLLTVRQKDEKFNAFDFIKRRGAVILLPYIAFCIIYFFWSAAIGKPIITQTILAFSGNFEYMKLFIARVLYGTWSHLYFFCMLFQLYLVYAIFHTQINKILAKKRSAIICFGIILALYPLWRYLQIFVQHYPNVITNTIVLYAIKSPTRQLFEWVFAFYVGLMSGVYYKEIFLILAVKRVRIILGAIAVLSLLSMIYVLGFPPSGASWVYNYSWAIFTLIYSFCATYLFLFWGKKLYEKGKNFTLISSVAAYSFGIYLLHPLILSLLRDISGFSPSYALLNISPYLYLPIIFALAVIVPYCMVDVSTKAAKKYRRYSYIHRFLFGR